MQSKKPQGVIPPHLADFVLPFIQAFLKPGRLETAKSRRSLYDALQRLLRGKGDISFVAVGAKGRREPFVWGPTTEPLALRLMLPSGMAAKFAEVLERRSLCCFSLKAGLSAEELEAFIGMLTQAPLPGASLQLQRDRLTREMVRKEILLASVLFSIDLVGQRERLSWRAQTALSRLKRDLDVLPLYRHLPKKKIETVRRQVLEGVLRSVKDPGPYKEILLNLDLIGPDLDGLDPQELQVRVLDFADGELLVGVVRELVTELGRIREAFREAVDVALLERQEAVRTLTARVARKVQEQQPEDGDLLYLLVREKVFQLADLPVEMRELVERKQALEAFIKNSHQYYADIYNNVDEADIARRVRQLFGFLPMLFGLGRHKDVSDILRVARDVGIALDVRNDAALAQRIVLETSRGAAQVKKEELSALFDALGGTGRLGIFVMTELLDHHSRFVRRAVLAALVKKGASAVPYLLKAIRQKDGWHYLRNALMVLGRLGRGNAEVERLVRRCLGHPEANVRREAAQAVADLETQGGDRLLTALLQDPAVEVGKKAVALLPKIEIFDPQAVDFLCRVCRGEVRLDESLGEALAGNLAHLRLPQPAWPLLEAAILEGLKKPSLLEGLKRKRPPLSPAVRTGLIAALGAFGGERSLEVLKREAGDRRGAARREASAAIAAIGARGD